MITKTSAKQGNFALPATPPIVTALLLAVVLSSQCQLLTASELPVNLGKAGNFAVLAGSTVTSSGATIIKGDLGLWPGTSIIGFPPGKVIGTEHINDPTAKAAQGDLTTAFNDAAGRTTAPTVVAGNIGGQTLPPGLYKSTSSLAISSGDLTLDGQGNANAVFIFQIASTLVTTSGRQVILIGGAQAANVFWQVGTSATIGTTSHMKGNIMADQSITIDTGATLDGRALARIGAVTMDSNLITRSVAVANKPPVCSLRISCAFKLKNHSESFTFSLDQTNACVILDATHSSDANHNALQMVWVIDVTNIQSGAIITNCFTVGCHSIQLAVSDGLGGVANCETKLCVITPGEAIAELYSLVEHANLGPSKGPGSVNKKALLATLKAAGTDFDNGDFKAGVTQLHSFEKALSQLAKTQSSAKLLIGTAQTILGGVDCAARMILGGGTSDGDADDR